MKLTDEALKNIMGWIKELGNTQKAFSIHTGISQSDVCKILTNNEISKNNLLKICNKFQVSERIFLNSVLHNEKIDIFKIFDEKYFAYFFNNKNKIDVAELSIIENSIEFTIKLEAVPSKKMIGKIYIDNNFLCFNLSSFGINEKYHSFVMMPYPHIVPPKKYFGGTGIFLEPSKSSRIPCAKKIIISNSKFLLENEEHNDYIFLVEQLKLKENTNFLEVSLDSDLYVFEHIKDKLYLGKDNI